MARSAYVANIDSVCKAIWPLVSADWQERRVAGGRRNRARERFTAVIWELANAGHVRSDADQRLYEALEFYYKTYEVEDEDAEIFNAFQALKAERLTE